jgi:hypothetical protein
MFILLRGSLCVIGLSGRAYEITGFTCNVLSVLEMVLGSIEIVISLLRLGSLDSPPAGPDRHCSRHTILRFSYQYQTSLIDILAGENSPDIPTKRQ